MNLRERQKQKRRDEILLAGLDLFVKKGYASTKTSDIAKAVNMSDGLLFHYFATKESLYGELIRIGMESSQEWIENSSSSPLQFFRDIAERIFQMIQENPQGAKFFVLIAQALRSSATPEEILLLLEPQQARYIKTVNMIQEGQARGEIRSGDPRALAMAYWCSIQGIAEQLAVSPQSPPPKAEWIVSILKGDERNG